MSKHTPGPWKWMESELNERIAIKHGVDREELTKEHGLMVFSLKGPNASPIEEEQADRWDYPTVMELAWVDVNGDWVGGANPGPADARLIAAAPELLEALELALGSHNRLLLSDPSKDAWVFYGVEAKARAAIAKAKGEE